MDNLTAASSLCTAICNTFYPDRAAVEIALFNSGIDPDGEAAPKDAAVFKVAARLVTGYVEGSRSEGGVSASVRSDEAVRRSLLAWCAFYGVDAEEVMPDSLTAIDDISDLW